MNNRIYKFRAWDKEYKKMLEGYKHPYGHSGLWLDIETGNLTHIQRGEEGVECSIHKFKNVVLMQYTGRKDKNRKEIYEGNIVVTGLGDVYLVQVKNFSDGYGFHFAKNGYLEKYIDGKDTIEIIGNIYENPELYEENK